MNDNDLIAEYIKENYPEMLGTFDFAMYKLHAACRELGKVIAEEIKKIDFSGLNKALHEAGEAMKTAGISGFDPLDCTGCVHEESGNRTKKMICAWCKRKQTDEDARNYHADLYESPEDKE